MTQLAYPLYRGNSSTLLETLKELFRATPLAIFAQALQARR